MANLNAIVRQLRQALGSIPRSDVAPSDWPIVEAYREALDDFERLTQPQFRSSNASDQLEGVVAEATSAAADRNWRAVIRHAFTAIGSLPGKPTWKPRRPLPPPL